ncbi:MAG: ORF6N domain-containing protein [candidate division NC10 bacterium]
MSLVSTRRIERAILLIRGEKVVLDATIAHLYGVTVKRLNEAVKRNRDRFPPDFMLQLTKEEFDRLSARGTARLRSQFATSNVKQGRGGRRFAPYAFSAPALLDTLSLILKESTRVAESDEDKE